MNKKNGLAVVVSAAIILGVFGAGCSGSVGGSVGKNINRDAATVDGHLPPTAPLNTSAATP